MGCGDDGSGGLQINAGMEAALDGPAAPGSPDLDTVVDSVEAFWAEVDAVEGFAFESIGDRYFAVSELSDRAATCDGEPIPREQAEGNAFAVGCREGVTVVYDDEELLPLVADRHGRVGPAVVIAHEWGHVAQFQGFSDIGRLPSIVTELQADCLAGAWVRHAFAEEFDPFTSDAVIPDLLETGVGFRDALGTSPDDPFAHGSGFDRVRAVQDGLERGVEECATYDDPDRDLGVTQIPFADEAEAASEGNLPIEELVPLAAADLDAFWSLVDGFEDAGDPLADLDEGSLRRLHDEIGDNATAVMLSLAYAAQAQEVVGADLTGREPSLQRACLTGVWLGQLARGDASASLSPGDLDEAIMTFLRLADDDDPTQAFDLISSLRNGFEVGDEDRGFACGLE